MTKKIIASCITALFALHSASTPAQDGDYVFIAQALPDSVDLDGGSVSPAIDINGSSTWGFQDGFSRVSDLTSSKGSLARINGLEGK